MSTQYGICPSFHTFWARHILFADPMLRAKAFVVFDDAGNPTQELSPLDVDGWPRLDGRWHGAVLFADMAGTSPLLEPSAGGPRIKQNGNGASISWKTERPRLAPLSPFTSAGFYQPGLVAIRQFTPATLRTLDWQRTNEKPDWSKPRVSVHDPIQGSARGMALEFQIAAANATRSALWWPAPPRFELSVPLWQAKIGEMLQVIRDNCAVPPVIEWGNEAWNEGFKLNSWLHAETKGTTARWTDIAAREINYLWEVVDRVFDIGRARKFVGGHIQDPSVLEKIIRASPRMPDLAGPAVYVGALKNDMLAWEANGTVPDQVKLRDSTLRRAVEVDAKLDQHAQVCSRYGIKLAVYEAGQSFIANGKPWKAAAIQAQREEWMREVYVAIRSMCERRGVSVANFYSLMTSQNPGDSRVDVFGLAEGMGLPLLAKAQAAMGR